MTPEANAADLIQRQQRSKFLSTNKIFPHSLEILLEFEAFLSFFLHWFSSPEESDVISSFTSFHEIFFLNEELWSFSQLLYKILLHMK